MSRTLDILRSAILDKRHYPQGNAEPTVTIPLGVAEDLLMMLENKRR
jgi:hypothetical protein